MELKGIYTADAHRYVDSEALYAYSAQRVPSVAEYTVPG